MRDELELPFDLPSFEIDLLFTAFDLSPFDFLFTVVLAPFIPHPSSFILQLRSLIERVPSLAVEVVEVFRLDKVESGTADSLQQGDDLVVRNCARLRPR